MNYKTGAIASALVLCTAIASHSVVAETIVIPVASQGSEKSNIERPRKGTSQSEVLRRFGEPLGVSGPVGDPPIDRWNYQNFSVYFEGDRVLHSVLKQDNPKK